MRRHVDRSPSGQTICPRSGKRGYESPQAARRANRTNGARLRLYRCPVCNRWHTTRDV